jgi:aryl-alcohol dehydrogenase
LTRLSKEHVQKIQAAVLHNRGGPLKIESLQPEGPREDEVLVRIVATGIFRTDIVSIRFI